MDLCLYAVVLPVLALQVQQQCSSGGHRCAVPCVGHQECCQEVASVCAGGDQGHKGIIICQRHVLDYPPTATWSCRTAQQDISMQYVDFASASGNCCLLCGAQPYSTHGRSGLSACKIALHHLCMQVLRRSSVDVIAPFLDPYLDVIMSVEGTRMRLLALSSLVPGASTLIANLLRSSGPNAGFSGGSRHSSTGSSSSPWSSSTTGRSRGGPVSSMDAFEDAYGPFSAGWQKLQAAVRSLDDVTVSSAYQAAGSRGSRGSRRRGKAADGAEMLAGRRWLREYADGAHCELFFVPAGPPLAGLRFTDAAQAVYEASGALVVGLIEVRGCWINPSTP